MVVVGAVAVLGLALIWSSQVGWVLHILEMCSYIPLHAWHTYPQWESFIPWHTWHLHLDTISYLSSDMSRVGRRATHSWHTYPHTFDALPKVFRAFTHKRKDYILPSPRIPIQFCFIRNVRLVEWWRCQTGSKCSSWQTKTSAWGAIY